MKNFKVCLGVGTDQLFPKYITIELASEDTPIKNETEKEVKKRGRKPKSKNQ